MPSLPQIQHHGRTPRDEGPPAWAQAPSPFNTPPPSGDSVENISDLLGLTMPIATRTGENYNYNQLQQFQARPNQEYCSWGTSLLENTPPPQGDSFDGNITDLLSLNMPRGSLLGNSNPIGTPTYNVSPPYDSSNASSLQQSQQGVKYACYQPPRFEPPTISTPRKSVRSQEFSPTSPFSQVSPICPPQQLASPPYTSSRNSSEDSIVYQSPTQRSNEAVKPTSSDHSNAVQNLSAMFCPSTEQELNNIQNLLNIRKESDLVNRIIEHTSRLILAAVNSPEVKSNEPPQFPLPLAVPQEKSVVPRYQQRALVPCGGNQVAERGNVCTWSGNLPARIHSNPTYSCKVFLGGVPWDITEMTLIQAFSKFGSIKIEWPGKDMPNQANQPKGYAYIIFETEKKVKALLDCCIHDYSKGGNWYYRLSSRKLKAKEVQVIPWAVSDSNYAQVSQKLDPQKTVFVGALHGMINAKALAKIMNDLFGGVIYAGLDTDKYKYPIGSARVTFNNHRSYMKAVLAAFIDIKTSKFSKKVQVNPYLEDSPCSVCSIQHGPYFCREIACFNYYCRGCWALHHSTEPLLSHTPLTRNSKNNKITTVCVSHNSLQQHIAYE